MPTTDRRSGDEVLGRQECMRLLATHPVGRVAVVVDGSPEIFPVSHHVVDCDDIVFHSAEASKIAGVSRGVRMSLEIDGVDDAAQPGWSVTVNGIGREVDPEEMARLRNLGLEPGGPDDDTHWIRITPETIIGRRFPTRA